MNEPLAHISEDAANNLLEAFKSFGESAKNVGMQFNMLRMSMLKSEMKFFTIKLMCYSALKLLYEVKLSNSNFITRWYYRKKLYKTILTLRKYQQGKLYIESLLNE